MESTFANFLDFCETFFLSLRFFASDVLKYFTISLEDLAIILDDSIKDPHYDDFFINTVRLFHLEDVSLLSLMIGSAFVFVISWTLIKWITDIIA